MFKDLSAGQLSDWGVKGFPSFLCELVFLSLLPMQCLPPRPPLSGFLVSGTPVMLTFAENGDSFVTVGVCGLLCFQTNIEN